MQLFVLKYLENLSSVFEFKFLLGFRDKLDRLKLPKTYGFIFL